MSAGGYQVRSATPVDSDALLAIYAPWVRDSVVSFELEVPSREEFRQRVSTILDRYPWLLCEEGNEVVGYAYAAPHRDRPAYRWSVEVSVYVDSAHHRHGVARLLYEALFDELRERGFYNAYAGMTLPNEASRGFHLSCGFEPIGVYRKVGYKMGSWRDVEWFGLALQEHRSIEG